MRIRTVSPTLKHIYLKTMQPLRLNPSASLFVPESQFLQSASSYSSTTAFDLVSTRSSERLLKILQKMDILDEQGILKNPEALPPFPSLDSSQIETIRKLLDQDICSVAAESHSPPDISLRKILLALTNEKMEKVPEIELVGGFARKVLLGSSEFIVNALCLLTNLSPDEVLPLIEDAVQEEGKRKIPDVDVRIHAPNSTRQDLCGFTNDLVKFSSEHLQVSPYQIRQKAFSKFNVVFDESNQFSIAALKSFGTFEYELLFVGHFLRTHLFVHDSLRLSIFPFLLEIGPPSLKSDVLMGWQPFIDLLTKVVHIPKPDSIDLFGLPVLMSYYTRGYLSADTEAVKTLAKKVTTMSQYHVGIPSQVAGLLTTTLHNHHPQDPHAAIALTINACLRLPLSALEIASIWNQMAKAHWVGKSSIYTPFLSLFDEAIRIHNIPFAVVEAALTLYALHENCDVRTLSKQRTIQLRLEEGHCIQLVKSPENALKILESYFLENTQDKFLFSLLMNPYVERAASPIQKEDFADHAFALLHSKSRDCRVLGCLALITVMQTEKNEQALSNLLIHFFEALHHIPKNDQDRFLDKMEAVADSSLIVQFRMEFEKGLPASKLLMKWVSILAESRMPLYSHAGFAVWERYREKFTLKLQQKMDDRLIIDLLPGSPELSIALFETRQINYAKRLMQQEFTLLSSLLACTQRLPSSQFALLSPRIAGLLSSALSDSLIPCSHENFPSSFITEFSAFIHQLIACGDTTNAHTLLELSLKISHLPSNDPQLYACWPALAEKNLADPAKALELWTLMETFGPCHPVNIGRYCHVCLSLIERWVKQAETREVGYQFLVTISKTSDNDERIGRLANEHLQHLIHANDTVSANRLLNKVYARRLAPESSYLIRKQLFHIHLEKREFVQAYALWKSINDQDSQATRLLLDSLIHETAQKKHLKAALKLINEEISDIHLPPVQKLTYAIKVYHRLPSQKLLRDIIDRLDSDDLSNPILLDIADLFLSFLKKNDPIEKALRDTLIAQFTCLRDCLVIKNEPFDLLLFAEKAVQEKILPDDPESFLSLCQAQTAFHSELRDIPTVFRWIHCASSVDHSAFFQNWVPDLLQASRAWDPNEEAKLLISSPLQILEAIPAKKAAKRAAKLASSGKLNPQSIVPLAQLYPPHEASQWSALIQSCSSEDFLLWKMFHSWFDAADRSDPLLQDAILKAVSKFFLSPYFPALELLQTLSTSSSALGCLFPDPSPARLTLIGKLILSAIKDADDLSIIKPFFNQIEETYSTPEDFPLYSTVALEIANKLEQFPHIPYLQFGCEILSTLVNKTLSTDPEEWKEEIVDRLAAFAGKASTFQYEKDSDLIPLLIGASSLIRNHFPDRMHPEKLAEAFAHYHNPLALKECHSLLELCADTQITREIWSIYLPHWLKQAYDLSKPRDQKGALVSLLANISKLSFKASSLASTLDVSFELAILQLNTKRTLPLFCHFVPTLFQSLFGKDTAFTTTLEMPLLSFDSPILSCCSSVPEHRALFFQAMHRFLNTLLNRPPIDHSLEEYIHHFLTKNMSQLCQQFPEEHLQLVQLLDRFFFRYPPTPNTFFPAHVTHAGSLLLEAIISDIYEHHPEKLNEAMMYLEMKTVVGKSFPTTLQPIILERVINRVLAFRTPYATVRAVLIMQGVQRYILQNNSESLFRIYTKLVDSIDLDPFFVWNKSTIFEWVRLGIMQDHIIGFQPTDEGLRTASRLCELLFSKVFQLYHSPDRFKENSAFSRPALLEWLGKFLLLSRQHGGYWERMGAVNYYRRVEAIVPDVIKEYPQMETKHQKHISELFTRVIIGEGYTMRTGLNSKLRQQRMELMRDWLISIAFTSDLCEEQLSVADKMGVFEGKRKEYNKVKKALKFNNSNK
jgi:hypothetical protein